MRLYLSSYKLCKEPTKYSSLFGQNKTVGFIRNSLDFSTDWERLKQGYEEDVEQLTKLGLSPVALDLRQFFGRKDALREKLATLGGLWVVGGNTFILRKAMHLSGLDVFLKEQTGNNEFVYGGYSAGICVLAPTLNGIHLVDNTDAVPHGYDTAALWDGLGLISYSLAPHYQSNHPESAAIQDVVHYFIQNKILFRCLHDGESIVV